MWERIIHHSKSSQDELDEGRLPFQGCITCCDMFILASLVTEHESDVQHRVMAEREAHGCSLGG